MRIIKTYVDKITYEKSSKSRPSKTKLGETETVYPADYRWDDQLKGFGVRVYPSGARAFVVTYRTETGTKRFFRLGKYGELTVDQARRLALDKLGEVRHGGDPQADRAAKRGEMTFNELANSYLENQKSLKKSLRTDKQRLRDHIRPEIGRKKLSEITPLMLERMQRRLRNKRSETTKRELSNSTVNRCTALVKTLFNTGVKHRLLESSPAQHLPMLREPPPRDIVLTPEQCKKILSACDKDENIYAAALFKLAMLTGRRVGELLSLLWENIDLKNYRATLPDTKVGERQFVILNEPAAAILRTLPHIEGNPYVIAGAAEGKPLNFYVRAWRRILKRAKIKPFPPHGLRHNYVSMLIAAGEPPDVVGHLVGHKTSITTRKYLHHMPDNLRRTTDKFANVINFKAEKKKRKASAYRRQGIRI